MAACPERTRLDVRHARHGSVWPLGSRSFGSMLYLFRLLSVCSHCSKLFILYINDICNVSPVLKFILFADDTNIFCSGSDIVQLSIIVSNELDKLNEWFAVNKLSLNLSKTNFMLFTNIRRDQNVSIRINNCEIDMVYKTKLLGVMLDSKLN